MDITDAAVARQLPAPPRHVDARRKAYAVLLAAAVIVPTSTVAAFAAVTPVALPQGVTMFPERDFLGAEGFPLEPLTVNVYRGAVKVGVAHGTPTVVDGATLLEVNHPGGVCWSGSTPDLLANDRVEVLVDSENTTPGTTNGQDANVQNVTAEPATKQALDADGVMDDVVVHGTATSATGGRIAEALVEQRIINPDFLGTSIAKRDIRALFGAGARGVVAWDSAVTTDTHWTATYKDIGTNIADLAVAGGTRVMSWERTNDAGDRIGMTIYEAGETGGPGIGGCPAAAVDAVTGTTPTKVNIATMAAADLVISGVSYNASAVTVTVDDSDADTTDALTATATLNRPASTVAGTALPGAQTWTASLPMAAVTAGSLLDGELTVSGTYQRVSQTSPETRTEGAIGGAQLLLVKDTIAPPTPTVSLPGGSYTSAQSVSLFAADASQETVRYTIGTAPADPTINSPVASGQIIISASQTLKAVSFDQAGNPSPMLTAVYTIGQPPPSPPPSPNAAPTVTARTPAVDATSVSQANNIAATFSEAVNGVTGTTFTVRPASAAATSAAIPATVTRNGTTNQWFLNPTANLAGDTLYTVRLTGGAAAIRDLAGAPLVSTSWNFRTGPAPTVTARTPGVNATAVGGASNITATFSEPLAVAPAAANVSLRAGTTATGTLIASAVSYNATTRVVTLNPTANLASDTRYTVRIAGLRDVAGNPMADVTWSFLTGPAPSVTARTPGIGAIGSSRTGNVTATFSEALAAAPTSANVSLRLGTSATGTFITSAVTYNATTRVVTLNPGVTLAARTQYTVRLATTIRDVAGNPLPATTWSFTTGA